MEKNIFEFSTSIQEKKPDPSESSGDITAGDNSSDNKIQEKGITRRDFLKQCLAVAGGIVAENIISQTEKAEAAAGFFEKARKFIESKARGYELVIYHKNKDLETIDKVLDFKSNKPIQINKKISQETKDYWKLEYMGNPKMADSLIGAYSEMKKGWISKLKKIFEEEGVPEKYLYLAIPESHWNLDATSSAGARGPYQFMKDTAIKFGLKINGKSGIDERTDPLKSGQACARLLKDLYKRTGDWDLALSGYNGGLIWDYLKYCRHNNLNSDYKNFLFYLEKEANRYKFEYHTGKMKHEVEKGESLKDVAVKYKVSEKAIKKMNNVKMNKMEPGTVLHVYVSDRKTRENILKRRKATLSENLNYPPKFNAVSELIEEGISVG